MTTLRIISTDVKDSAPLLLIWAREASPSQPYNGGEEQTFITLTGRCAD